MMWKILFGVFAVLVFITTTLMVNLPDCDKPIATEQYTNPIGPTQEEPFILESEVLVNGKGWRC